MDKQTNCKNCSKLLTKTQKSYCSYKCWNEYRNKQWTTKCFQCQKEFILPHNRRGHKRKLPDSKVFCSKECWLVYWHQLKVNKIKQQ